MNTAKPKRPATARARARRARPQPALGPQQRATEANAPALQERLRTAEAQLARLTLAEQRLEAAARKATFVAATIGLAHDFNNQMAGVLALSELLLAQTPAEDPKRAPLETIKRSAIQAAHLLKRLVQLYRGKTGVRQYLDLNQVVAELAELADKLLPRRVQLQTELAPESLPVYLDGVEFGQAFLGLVLNAAEAMSQGGKLALRLSAQATAPELQHARGNLARLPCACLAVQDQGTGIDASLWPSLFEPFVSTKPPSEGAGLGLYRARRFAEQHGGAISVESAPGTGTKVCLWLPQADLS